MSIMDPEFFGTILRPKLVNDREIVVVAHDSLRLESVIDGTDNSGFSGATWHMDQADPNLHVALLNLEAIMREMGWVIDAGGWTCVEGEEHIWFADFERLEQP